MFYFNCDHAVVVCALCLFLMVLCLVLQSVLVTSPGHTHLLFHYVSLECIGIYAADVIIKQYFRTNIFSRIRAN